jgi:probable HAF family extracellular repeat protein
VVIGETVDNLGVIHAFRWTVGSPVAQTLGFLGTLAQSSSGKGVSADGAVVVGVSVRDTFVAEAFRWTSATGMVGLGDLPGSTLGDGSYAFGVSADGSVVVGYGNSSSGQEAFRWTAAGGMVGLGDLAGGAFDSRAVAVSPDGSVVVGTGATAAGSEVFVWDATHGMRRLESVLESAGLDLTGWTLDTAGDVTLAAGQLTIAGSGQNPSSRREAWRARLPVAAVVPGPGAGALWIGALVIGGWAAHALRAHTGSRVGARRGAS